MRDRLLRLARRFVRNTRGNVAMLLGFLAVPLVGAIGLSVDYARSSAFKSKLEAAAAASAIAGVDMMRTMLAADPNTPTSQVTSAAEEAMLKMFQGRRPAQVTVTSSKGSVVRDGDTITAKLSYAATAPTIFTALINIQTMDVGGAVTSTGPTAATAAQPTGDPNTVFKDDLKIDSPTQSNTLTRVSEYNGWRLPPGGLEINTASTYKVEDSPTGGLLVELDSDKNGAMARKIYLTAGNYDLRYYVRDRVSYPAYDPVYLCSIAPGELNWVTATGQADGKVFPPQTNRIGVYLERALGDDPPAVFPSKESDSSLIDMCMSTGGRWIERRVRLVVQTPALFWLAFQAEGPSDGYGALLGGVRLCRNSCSGASGIAGRIFPWSAGQTLFTDSFTTPSPPGATLESTLDRSGVSSGWATPAPRNWVTTPINQIDHKSYLISGATMNFVELDGSYENLLSRQGDEVASNRAIHRKFLLAPGLYLLSYDYLGKSDKPVASEGVYCGVAKEQENVAAVGTASAGLGVYMDTQMLFSIPSVRAGLRNVATWIDGNGGPPTSPRIGSQLVDSCVYASVPTTRQIYLRITKSAEYWLSFAATGGDATADQWGPNIGNVKLSAVGGRSASAPTGATVVDVAYRGRMLNTVRDGYYVQVTSQ